MNQELAEIIFKISGNDILLLQEPEILDFTSQKPAKLIIKGGGYSVQVDLPTDDKSFKETLGWITECFSDKIVFGWNIKNLFSYFLFRTKKPIKIPGQIIDLKIMESYLGLNKHAPTSFDEAKSRLKLLMQDRDFDNMLHIYRKTYLPLIKSVIPKIECLGLNDLEIKKTVYPYYEIVSTNGRMKCSKAFSRSINPHAISDNSNYIPVGFDKIFIYLDFKYMEVAVLQWLSGDVVLKQIMDSGKDLYSTIWEEITGIKCTEEYREKCKLLFLPVVYGLGKTTLAKQWQIPEDVAKKLVDRIHARFHIAMNWIQNQQNSAVNGRARSYFGKIRYFTEDLYRVRNFAVQSAGASVCNEKLIQLSENIYEAGIACYIHDGYIIVTDKINYKTVLNKAIEALEADYQGLKLKVSYRVGSNLNDLRSE